jgi:hypothetical protein
LLAAETMIRIPALRSGLRSSDLAIASGFFTSLIAIGFDR